MKIPEQLQGWRFVLISRGKKKPFEEDWPRTANYSYADSKLLEHLIRGGNYGVLGSEDHVIVDGDTPEIQQAVEEHLPLTFTVRTPGHQGRHYYFLCKLERPIRLRDKNKVNIGDIQGIGKQVVGPNCIHPNGKTYEVVNDRPPNWVAPDDLKRALKEFIINEPPSAEFAQGEHEALVGEGLKADIKITDVHPLEGMIRCGDEYYGSHPVHGSEGGQNFWINAKKNVWTCFRHSTGGGPLSLLAVKEGIIKCEDAIRGVLRGTEFNQVLKLAREKGILAGEDKRKITDKLITDAIMNKHLFYCDIADVNQILYIYAGNHWSNSEAESIILNELSDIFKDEERRRGMSLERTVNFIKGQAMNLKVVPKPPDFISFKNGMYDLEMGELKPHDPKYFYVNLIPHDYDQAAKCPKWLKYLEEVMPPEKDREFAQEWWGYNLYETTPENAFTILTGTGQNSKTVFLEVMGAVIGEANTTGVSLYDLTTDIFAPAELHHKLSNISDDIGKGIIKNTGKLKEITSGSLITAQRKFGQLFNFRPYAKITYSCNEPPEIKDESDAIKHRMQVIEFPVTFSKNPTGDEHKARDRKKLVAELLEEAQGIVNWALEGLKRFLGNGCRFTQARSTEETWKFYQRKARPVVCFIDECLTFTDNDADVLTKEGMFKAFKAWIVGNKVKLRVSRDKFFKDMKDQGIDAVRSRIHEMKRVYLGVVCSNVPSYKLPIRETQIERIEEAKREKKDNRYIHDLGTLEQHLNTTPQLDHIRRICEIIDNLTKEYDCGAPLEEVKRIAEPEGITSSFIDALIDRAKQQGHIYEPKSGFVARVEAVQ